VNVFRRLSSRGLIVAIVSVLALSAAAAVGAVAAFGGDGSPPPPEPLSQAIENALTAPPVDGISARIQFTNHLLPSGSLGALAGASPLLSGASGRLWLTSDGKVRLELQSDAGDAQIVSDGTTLTVYDASSNTAYTATLPASTDTSTSPDTPPSLSEVESGLAELAGVAVVSGAMPDSIAGQPAYTVHISPKDSGGLIGGGDLSFDAVTGVPLRVAIYARGDSSPVLELTATDITYGPVSDSDVNITPPPGAKMVTLPSFAGDSSSTSSVPPVTGVDAVSAAVPFTLVAPDSLNGLARSEVRLTGGAGDEGALITYGDGLGTVFVSEHAADTTPAAESPLDALPEVTINGAKGHELVTALGTVLQFDSGGVTYTVGGSVTQADAEAAAQALTP
jgi:outer membrane lipoprotein-sorting protein